ncbi:MAG TPA: hypothetical protein VFZ30_08765, partial [Acidimicrobiales bacterium]
MSDRFQQPERAAAGDQRRIFIPAPSSSPGRPGAAGGTSAPPRRERDRPPPPPGSPRPPIPRDAAGPPSARVRSGRRFRWRRVLVALAVLLVVGLVGSYLYARSIFNRIDRVEVSQSLTSSSSGTNYLIVGSD